MMWNAFICAEYGPVVGRSFNTAVSEPVASMKGGECLHKQKNSLLCDEGYIPPTWFIF
jgi:hypothetical protein